MSNVTIPSSDEKGGTNELVLNFTPLRENRVRMC